MAIETAKDLGTNGWPKNLTKITADIYRYISYKPTLQPSLTTKEWMCNTAREIEAATQPLSHSPRVAGPATLTRASEWLSGWVAEWEWLSGCGKINKRNSATQQLWQSGWTSHSATQPLWQSGWTSHSATQPLWVTEWLSGWSSHSYQSVWVAEWLSGWVAGLAALPEWLLQPLCHSARVAWCSRSAAQPLRQSGWTSHSGRAAEWLSGCTKPLWRNVSVGE